MTTSLGAMFEAWKYMQFIGNLEGKLTATNDGTVFALFDGIQYAKAPVGKLSFKDPVPSTENFNLKSKVDCLEIEPMSGKSIGVEDCLFLNVYTPMPYVNKSMPVMIWIHGTALPLGANEASIYEPIDLLSKGIVVVTISYRQGPLGFASMEDPSFPGNYGFIDQTVAIKWVIKNIHLFGGNPKKITLAGEGAGASYVLFHLNSKLSSVIKRGIALSGTRFATWALSSMRWVRNRTKDLFYSLRCHEAKCLRMIPSNTIVDVANQLRQNMVEWSDKIVMHFKPVVDGNVISQPWLNSSEKKNFSLLMGLNKQEGKIIEIFVNKYNWSEETIKSITETYSTDMELLRILGKTSNPNLYKAVMDNYKEALPLDRLKGVIAHGWFYFPAVAEARHHGGRLNAFMFDYSAYKPPLNCTMQYKLPFFDIKNDCPKYDANYEEMAAKFKTLISNFVQERELNLKNYANDKEIFNITEEINDPAFMKKFENKISLK